MSKEKTAQKTEKVLNVRALNVLFCNIYEISDMADWHLCMQNIVFVSNNPVIISNPLFSIENKAIK